MRLCAAKLTAFTGDVLAGDPKVVILDRARGSGAGLLVVGSHGASAVKRFLLGNVAATAVRYAPCSVEVARAKASAEFGSNLGNLKVLLATDGSASAESAARAIAERPWPAGTEVQVLSAVELILPPGRALFEVPIIDTEFLESARGEAMQRTQAAIARAREILSATGLNVSESLSVLAETPREIILRQAVEWNADLIVLGSHGRHGVDRFLTGSVSEAVATHAGCSVEVVRSA